MRVLGKIQEVAISAHSFITHAYKHTCESVFYQSEAANAQERIDRATTAALSLPPRSQSTTQHAPEHTGTAHAASSSSMAVVNVSQVLVLNNPASFFDPLAFDIQYECMAELESDLEWKMIYVGSAESEVYVQLRWRGFMSRTAGPLRSLHPLACMIVPVRACLWLHAHAHVCVHVCVCKRARVCILVLCTPDGVAAVVDAGAHRRGHRCAGLLAANCLCCRNGASRDGRSQNTHGLA